MYYSIQEASKILSVPYSSVARWVIRHNVSATTSISGKIRIGEEGLEELRSIASVKQQIRKIEEQRFGKKQ